MAFDRQRHRAAARAEAFARALDADDVGAFDATTQELVAVVRGLRPAQAPSEESRAATRDLILRGPRLTSPRLPADAQMSTPLTFSTAEVSDGGDRLLLADIEEITPERAAEVAARVQEVLAKLERG